ncbi:MAG: putative ATP-dependent helicase [bacterium]|nr:MAG: putative ATP-dependent helicase [bacterium]
MKKVEEIFGPGGALSRNIGDYECRPEQIEMARAVTGVIGSGGKLVVEAGTGTGKTLAYLVPAVLSGLRVVISTGTRNLQEQVFLRDIPFLQKRLGMDFTAVMLKGRSNYLCPLRLELFTQAPLFKKESDGDWWIKIHEWARKTRTGDRSELLDMPENGSIWPQICSNPDYCAAQKCPKSTGCFISNLRKEAEQSRIIVVNHHLFFADLAIREKNFSGVLPSYDAVVFDEAHQVHETASRFFGFSISNYGMEELSRDTLRETGELDIKDKKDFLRDLDHFQTRTINFFHSFRSMSDRRFALSTKKPEKEASELLLSSLALLAERIGSISGLPDRARALAHRYSITHSELSRIIAAEEEEYIFWGESRGSGLFLYASSMDVAPLLKANLYDERTVVFTSATVTSAGDFSYFCSQLGVEDAEMLALPSSFDFKKQVTIYLPRMPEPDNPRFIDALADRSFEIIEMVKGRTLFLFTSFRNMHELRKRMEGRIKYRILMQGESQRHTLLDKFRENVASVLLATSSFWEGVDVRGEALSCVIIDRLPFASPGDPIMAARIEHIRKKGGNPFMDYQLPDAVLSLKQGLGRLIRHRSDRGIMMIADPRIKTKSYGKNFMKSLPAAPVVDSLDKIRW